MERKYTTIEELIQDNLANEEDGNTILLIWDLKDVKQKGYFTKDELVRMGMRKSPRPKQKYLSNTDEDILFISKKVFTIDSEIEKMSLLTCLNGISIPAGSAILTLIDPQNYGVIDIRVWQVLHLYDVFEHNEEGKGFTIQDWNDYLIKLREYATIFHVPVRDIERTLFIHHKEIQEGNLYG